MFSQMDSFQWSHKGGLSAWHSVGMHAVTVPGRVNLIGEHIDYHNLPVLPMAIQRRIRLDYESITESLVRAESDTYQNVEVELNGDLQPAAAGDWSNYIKAAVAAVRTRWRIAHGIEAKVTSDLPAAAGLSSSSALMTGFTIALLRANGIEPSVDELMEVLPDGEQFVGTRGGGMDHAAVLASQTGCALLVEFAPLGLRSVPIPDTWSFIVAHSMKTAEKSGAAREYYNARRVAGQSALTKLGATSYRCAAQNDSSGGLARLNDDELRTFRHVVSEHRRVRGAVAALENADKEAFGALLYESHHSLRDDLRVSCAELDELVDLARKSDALGARLTGAGFGGCAIVFCEAHERSRIAQALVGGFYAKRSGFDLSKHLIFAEPSAGALGA
jgi:galactokinase